MKTDAQVEKEVKEELAWESRVSGAYIEVKVDKGIVTLTGVIDSDMKKNDAGIAAARVVGVVGVNNHLEVKIKETGQRKDEEIEKATLISILRNSEIEAGKIMVKVKNGHVTLEGEVPWEYLRSRAYHLAADMKGVTHVTNNIVVHARNAA